MPWRYTFRTDNQFLIQAINENKSIQMFLCHLSDQYFSSLPDVCPLFLMLVKVKTQFAHSYYGTHPQPNAPKRWILQDQFAGQMIFELPCYFNKLKPHVSRDVQIRPHRE